MGQTSYCNACQQTFSSTGAFDAHCVGSYRPICTRHCLTVAEMEAGGFLRNQHGRWITGTADPDVWLHRAAVLAKEVQS